MAQNAAKWVYGSEMARRRARRDAQTSLGGKGANLAEMSSLGLPVPPGFTVTTELCTYYYDNKETYPSELKDEVEKALASVEKIVGLSFGDANNPLLVSVRSERAPRCRHDGHRPEPRPQRQDGAGPRQVVGR